MFSPLRGGRGPGLRLSIGGLAAAFFLAGGPAPGFQAGRGRLGQIHGNIVLE
jgi:hypothetical protein